MIVDCLDGLDSETFYNNIFFTIATVAIAKIPLHYKKKAFSKKYGKMSLKGYTFCNANIMGYMSSSHHFTIMSLGQAIIIYRKVVTHFLT